MEISLSPQVILHPTDAGAILRDRHGADLYELDEVGMRLWQLLAADGDFEAAIKQLLDDFREEDDIDEEELRRELYELLEDMAQADLVAWG